MSAKPNPIRPSRAVKALERRLAWIEMKLKENPTDSFRREERQATILAIRCIKLVRDYGFVVVTDFGPLLPDQEDDPRLCYGKPEKKPGRGV